MSAYVVQAIHTVSEYWSNNEFFIHKEVDSTYHMYVGP